MVLLKSLWRFREVGYVLLILGLGYLAFRGDSSSDLIPVGDQKQEPVVVVDTSGEIARETLNVARRADRPKGLGERLGTREVQPDTVYLSPGPTGPDNGTLPRQVPSEPLELPEWGIQEVKLEGHGLRVTSLSRRTGTVEQSVHRLSGNYQPGLTIRAGNVPRVVREDRELRFLRLELALATHAGLNPATGAPNAQAILTGPVSVGGSHVRISPSVGASIDGGYSVGVGAEICLLGGCK